MGMMRTFALLAAMTAIFAVSGFLIAGQIGLIVGARHRDFSSTFSLIGILTRLSSR